MAPNVIDPPYRDFERAGWERAADSFEAATRLFAAPLLAAVGARDGMTLLDVACGTVFVAAAAAGLGAVASGVDFSKAMVAEASRRHPALRFLEADAEALPFPDGMFDAVVINFGVWATPDEHALHKIALGALREAGVAGAELPTPPGGAVNEIATCIDLLIESGFVAPPPRAEKVAASLWLESEQRLIDMLVDGTVRVSTLIRSQPAEKAAAIATAIRGAAAAFRDVDRLRIPVTSILAVGTKGTAP